MSAGR